MQGLNPDAELFLACRVAEVAPRNGHVPLLLQGDRLDGPVVLRDVTLTFRSQVRRTQQTHMVQQAFGISRLRVRAVRSMQPNACVCLCKMSLASVRNRSAAALY